MASRFVCAVILALGVVACTPDQPPPASRLVTFSPPVLVGQCEVLVPRALPSGAAPGEPIRVGDGRFSWGRGPDRVVEAIGEYGVGDPETLGVPQTSKQWVAVRGVPGLVVPLGEDGAGEIAITWRIGDCAYTVWLSAGQTIEDAIRYAGRF